jgi:glutathione synthase/RimK-type ligase-like ATP-grasp enzyme
MMRGISAQRTQCSRADPNNRAERGGERSSAGCSMNLRVVGVYREPEFSPGKIAADAAIIEQVLTYLRAEGASTATMTAALFADAPPHHADLVIAMCQGPSALSQLATMHEAGALTINSALAIRNCYRDLLAAGLMRAGVPIPEGVLVRTSLPLDLKPLRALDLSMPIYVKRGNLHALGPDDVRRVEGPEHLQRTLADFARRSVDLVYLQQEVAGAIVKFYGVGDEYFSAIHEDGQQSLEDSVKLCLERAARTAAAALGLEVWGGDAIVSGQSCSIIDFNDWPSFERVRSAAAAAIAQRCLRLLRRHPLLRNSLSDSSR